MGQKNSHHPKPGDLIEIKRGGYQHWALYVGDGYVIHVTTTGESSSSFHTPSATGKKGIVKKELLKDVVGNNKWSVNNKYDRFWDPLPVEEIIRRAEILIDVEVPYHLLKFNCEHFVKMLRYSVGDSEQVCKALGILHPFIASVCMVGLLSIPALVGFPPLLALGASVTTTASIVAAAGISNIVVHPKLSKKEQKMLL